MVGAASAASSSELPAMAKSSRLKPLLQRTGRCDFHQPPGGGVQRRHALLGKAWLGREDVATFQLLDLPVASVQPFHLRGVPRTRRSGLLLRGIFEPYRQARESAGP